MHLRYVFTLILLIPGCLPPASPPPQSSSQDAERTLTVNGVDRRYLVFTPPQAATATAANPLPVVLAYHWTDGSPEGMSSLTGFDDIAAREGFIVVYPAAIGGLWSDLRPGADPNTDDVAFTQAILSDLQGTYAIDSHRIYATGLSAGGHMCNFLAFRTTNQIAAIAPVAALLAQPLALLGAVSPPAPIPVLTIAGTSDPISPYNGGVVLNRGVTLSADDTVSFWVNVDHAGPTPNTFDLPDADPNDGTITHVRDYAAPASGPGAEVKLFTVEGGGHTWPGGPQYLPALIVGRVSHDFSASEEIWSFFANHPRP